MSNYSVPQEIRNLKPTGTMVKRIHNKYYVYEQRHVKQDGKWKTKMGKLIGSIDPSLGFVSNGSSLHNESITTVDFGEYFLAYCGRSATTGENIRPERCPYDLSVVPYSFCKWIYLYQGRSATISAVLSFG